jgi:hypothetical protein
MYFPRLHLNRENDHVNEGASTSGVSFTSDLLNGISANYNTSNFSDGLPQDHYFPGKILT